MSLAKINEEVPLTTTLQEMLRIRDAKNAASVSQTQKIHERWKEVNEIEKKRAEEEARNVSKYAQEGMPSTETTFTETIEVQLVPPKKPPKVAFREMPLQQAPMVKLESDVNSSVEFEIGSTEEISMLPTGTIPSPRHTSVVVERFPYFVGNQKRMAGAATLIVVLVVAVLFISLTWMFDVRRHNIREKAKRDYQMREVNELKGFIHHLQNMERRPEPTTWRRKTLVRFEDLNKTYELSIALNLSVIKLPPCYSQEEEANYSLLPMIKRTIHNESYVQVITRRENRPEWCIITYEKVTPAENIKAEEFKPYVMRNTSNPKITHFITIKPIKPIRKRRATLTKLAIHALFMNRKETLKYITHTKPLQLCTRVKLIEMPIPRNLPICTRTLLMNYQKNRGWSQRTMRNQVYSTLVRHKKNNEATYALRSKQPDFVCRIPPKLVTPNIYFKTCRVLRTIIKITQPRKAHTHNYQTITQRLTEKKETARRMRKKREISSTPQHEFYLVNQATHGRDISFRTYCKITKLQPVVIRDLEIHDCNLNLQRSLQTINIRILYYIKNFKKVFLCARQRPGYKKECCRLPMVFTPGIHQEMPRCNQPRKTLKIMWEIMKNHEQTLYVRTKYKLPIETLYLATRSKYAPDRMKVLCRYYQQQYTTKRRTSKCQLEEVSPYDQRQAIADKLQNICVKDSQIYACKQTEIRCERTVVDVEASTLKVRGRDLRDCKTLKDDDERMSAIYAMMIQLDFVIVRTTEPIRPIPPVILLTTRRLQTTDTFYLVEEEIKDGRLNYKTFCQFNRFLQVAKPVDLIIPSCNSDVSIRTDIVDTRVLCHEELFRALYFCDQTTAVLNQYACKLPIAFSDQYEQQHEPKCDLDLYVEQILMTNQAQTLYVMTAKYIPPIPKIEYEIIVLRHNDEYTNNKDETHCAYSPRTIPMIVTTLADCTEKQYADYKRITYNVTSNEEIDKTFQHICIPPTQPNFDTENYYLVDWLDNQMDHQNVITDPLCKITKNINMSELLTAYIMTEKKNVQGLELDYQFIVQEIDEPRKAIALCGYREKKQYTFGTPTNSEPIMTYELLGNIDTICTPHVKDHCDPMPYVFEEQKPRLNFTEVYLQCKHVSHELMYSYYGWNVAIQQMVKPVITTPALITITPKTPLPLYSLVLVRGSGEDQTADFNVCTLTLPLLELNLTETLILRECPSDKRYTFTIQKQTFPHSIEELTKGLCTDNHRIYRCTNNLPWCHVYQEEKALEIIGTPFGECTHVTLEALNSGNIGTDYRWAIIKETYDDQPEQVTHFYYDTEAEGERPYCYENSAPKWSSLPKQWICAQYQEKCGKTTCSNGNYCKNASKCRTRRKCAEELWRDRLTDLPYCLTVEPPLKYKEIFPQPYLPQIPENTTARKHCFTNEEVYLKNVAQTQQTTVCKDVQGYDPNITEYSVNGTDYQIALEVSNHIYQHQIDECIRSEDPNTWYACRKEKNINLCYRTVFNADEETFDLAGECIATDEGWQVWLNKTIPTYEGKPSPKQLTLVRYNENTLNSGNYQRVCSFNLTKTHEELQTTCSTDNIIQHEGLMLPTDYQERMEKLFPLTCNTFDQLPHYRTNTSRVYCRNQIPCTTIPIIPTDQQRVPIDTLCDQLTAQATYDTFYEPDSNEEVNQILGLEVRHNSPSGGYIIPVRNIERNNVRLKRATLEYIELWNTTRETCDGYQPGCTLYETKGLCTLSNQFVYNNTQINKTIIQTLCVKTCGYCKKDNHTANETIHCEKYLPVKEDCYAGILDDQCNKPSCFTEEIMEEYCTVTRGKCPKETLLGRIYDCSEKESPILFDITPTPVYQPTQEPVNILHADIYKYNPVQSLLTGIVITRFQYQKRLIDWIDPSERPVTLTQAQSVYELWQTTKESTGTTPIYSDGNKYYYHKIHSRWTGDNDLLDSTYETKCLSFKANHTARQTIETTISLYHTEDMDINETLSTKVKYYSPGNYTLCQKGMAVLYFLRPINHTLNNFEKVGQYRIANHSDIIEIPDLQIATFQRLQQDKYTILDNDLILISAEQNSTVQELQNHELESKLRYKKSIDQIQRENEDTLSILRLRQSLHSVLQDVKLLKADLDSTIRTTAHMPLSTNEYTQKTLGQLLAIYKCKAITRYKPIWTRRLGTTCFQEIPVRLKDIAHQHLEQVCLWNTDFSLFLYQLVQHSPPSKIIIDQKFVDMTKESLMHLFVTLLSEEKRTYNVSLGDNSGEFRNILLHELNSHNVTWHCPLTPDPRVYKYVDPLTKKLFSHGTKIPCHLHDPIFIKHGRLYYSISQKGVNLNIFPLHNDTSDIAIESVFPSSLTQRHSLLTTKPSTLIETNWKEKLPPNMRETLIYEMRAVQQQAHFEMHRLTNRERKDNLRENLAIDNIINYTKTLSQEERGDWNRAMRMLHKNTRYTDEVFNLTTKLENQTSSLQLETRTLEEEFTMTFAKFTEQIANLTTDVATLKKQVQNMNIIFNKTLTKLYRDIDSITHQLIHLTKEVDDTKAIIVNITTQLNLIQLGDKKRDSEIKVLSSKYQIARHRLQTLELEQRVLKLKEDENHNSIKIIRTKQMVLQNKVSTNEINIANNNAKIKINVKEIKANFERTEVNKKAITGEIANRKQADEKVVAKLEDQIRKHAIHTEDKISGNTGGCLHDIWNGLKSLFKGLFGSDGIWDLVQQIFRCIWHFIKIPVIVILAFIGVYVLWIFGSGPVWGGARIAYRCVKKRVKHSLDELIEATNRSRKHTKLPTLRWKSMLKDVLYNMSRGIPLENLAWYAGNKTIEKYNIVMKVRSVEDDDNKENEQPPPYNPRAYVPYEEEDWAITIDNYLRDRPDEVNPMSYMAPRETETLLDRSGRNVYTSTVEELPKPKPKKRAKRLQVETKKHLKNKLSLTHPPFSE